MATIENTGSYYELNLDNGFYCSFDETDADLDYVDNILESWKAWRAYVVRNGLVSDD